MVDDTDAASFRVLLATRGPAARLNVTDDADAVIAYTAGERAAIDAAVAAASESGRTIFDAPLYRLVDQGVHAHGAPWMSLGRCTFFEYVGTHMGAETFPPERQARPLGVSAVTVSTDGFVLVTRRSARVLVYPHHYDIRPGGHPHPPDSLEEAVLRELKEEANLAREDVASVAFLGVIENLELAKPEAVYLVKLAVDSNVVLKRAADAEDAWEGDLVLVPARVRDVNAILAEGPWSPSGRGALELASRAGLFAADQC